MLAQVGKGTFGRVLSCTHVYGKALLAIKKTRPNSLDLRGSSRPILNCDDIEARCQEVRTLIKLQSTPHVLQMYEYYWTGKDLYLVTELLAGSELQVWMHQQEEITEKMVKSIAKVLLQAIGHMHEKRVLHRDLKTQNLLFQVGHLVCYTRVLFFTDKQRLTLMRPSVELRLMVIFPA